MKSKDPNTEPCRTPHFPRNTVLSSVTEKFGQSLSTLIGRYSTDECNDLFCVFFFTVCFYHLPYMSIGVDSIDLCCCFFNPFPLLPVIFF